MRADYERRLATSNIGYIWWGSPNLYRTVLWGRKDVCFCQTNRYVDLSYRIDGLLAIRGPTYLATDTIFTCIALVS